MIIPVFYTCSNSQSFALSPSFPRQEVADDIHDAVKKDISERIVKVNYTDMNETIIANSIDMSHVTYLSDGKILNATLWLAWPGFDKTLYKLAYKIDFGMYIDVNPNSQMGNEAVSYHKQIIWPSKYLYDLPIYIHTKSNNSWIENIHEVLSAGVHRYLKIAERNLTDSLIQEFGTLIPGVALYLPVSVNLSDINFPEKYKVMFYTDVYLDNNTRIADFTNWIDIPTPKFFISTFPNPVELRPSDSRYITGILKTTSGFIPNVTSFRSDEMSNFIKVQPQGTSNSSPSGVHPGVFDIQVPSKDKIQAGEYTIPIAVNISTGPALFPPEFFALKEHPAYANLRGYLVSVANVTVKVLEPLSIGEQFKQFWDTYGQPISIVAGGLAGGAATLLFDRLKKKEDSPHNNHQIN